MTKFRWAMFVTSVAVCVGGDVLLILTCVDQLQPDAAMPVRLTGLGLGLGMLTGALYKILDARKSYLALGVPTSRLGRNLEVFLSISVVALLVGFTLFFRVLAGMEPPSEDGTREIAADAGVESTDSQGGRSVEGPPPDAGTEDRNALDGSESSTSATMDGAVAESDIEDPPTQPPTQVGRRRVDANAQSDKIMAMGDLRGPFCDATHSLCWQDPPAIGTSNWITAHAYCEWIAANNPGGWRLPEVGELESLLRRGRCTSRACPEDHGPGAKGCYWPSDLSAEGDCTWYWSADLERPFGSRMHIVNFSVAQRNTREKTELGTTRCVRPAP